MPRFFATCARGLEPILAWELETLHAADITVGRGGVSFAGEIDLLYRANLWLRTAVRVLQPILEFPVRSTDELYDAVRSLHWPDFMSPDHTLAVDSNVRDSLITHSQYAARRVKDGICDQFRELAGRRPSVDTETPMIGINLHISRNKGILSLDTSWNSLHKRGYRPALTRAPLNEALAAGLLLSTGWFGDVPLVDFMCGSGTFPIEAAWIATHRPPGLTRKWFGFMGWPSFDRQLWNAIRDDARDKVATVCPTTIIGSDIRRDVVDFAINNAKTAGVGGIVPFHRLDLNETRPPDGPPGILICNPPYGERIGDESELIRDYQMIGEAAGRNWPGWRLLVFTSNDMLARNVGLPVERRTPFYNGSLACNLWEYHTGG